MPAEASVQYEGKNSQGDHILYKPEKSNSPDQLTLISRELVKKPEIIDGTNEKSLQKGQGNGSLKKEFKELKEKWEKRETELGISSNSNGSRGFFCGRDDKGETVYEGTHFKSETQSYLILREGINSPQIQEITDEETEQELEKKEKVDLEKITQNSEKSKSDKNQELLKDKNNSFPLLTKIAIGSGIILTSILLVCIVKKWKNK